MRTSATLAAAAALLAATIGSPGSSLAAENGAAAGPEGVLAALAGTVVPASELGRQNARGLNNISVSTGFNFDGALSDGSLRGNVVTGTSDTGTITTSNSINNNTGITTVFQNSGNNSLFQQTTSIVITVH